MDIVQAFAGWIRQLFDLLKTVNFAGVPLLSIFFAAAILCMVASTFWRGASK